MVRLRLNKLAGEKLCRNVLISQVVSSVNVLTVLEKRCKPRMVAIRSIVVEPVVVNY